MIQQITEVCIDKSPIHLPYLSSHPKYKALVPLVGLETGSVRMAKQIMPSKGVPFPIEEWPSVLVRGLEVMNKHNWFPGDDAHHRQPGRDGRGRQGHDRPDLRSRAARPVRVLHPVDLHAAPRHANGEQERRLADPRADAAPVAADDEVLEDESASRSGELVGADRVARRRARTLGVEATQAQWPGLHVADVHVCECPARKADGQDGENPSRSSAETSRRERNCWRRSSLTSTSSCVQTRETCPSLPA